MPTDDGAAYYSGRKQAWVAISNAPREAGIGQIHVELARHSADLAEVSGSQKGSSQRQTAHDVTVVSRSAIVPPRTGEAKFRTTWVACQTSDLTLARAGGAAPGIPAPGNSP